MAVFCHRFPLHFFAPSLKSEKNLYEQKNSSASDHAAVYFFQYLAASKNVNYSTRSGPRQQLLPSKHVGLIVSLFRDRVGRFVAHDHRPQTRTDFMADFTPISAAIGGALIGLAAVLLMLLNGRIAGVTGVFAGLINPIGTDRAWRATFIAGLIAAPLSAVLLGFTLRAPQMPTSLAVVAAAGLLVGFGARLSNGCTSGHGVCGIARLSPRSIGATAIFMAAAMVVVALTRHVFGG
jgi:uncharacterized protein